MADPSQAPPFASPDDAPSDRLGDYDDSLMLIWPLSTKTVDTEFGASDVTEAHVTVALEGGKVVTLPNSLIFWKSVRSQLERFVGTDQAVAGKLVQGAGRNKKAFSLLAATAADHPALMAALDHPSTVAMLKGETKIEDAAEPF